MLLFFYILLYIPLSSGWKKTQNKIICPSETKKIVWFCTPELSMVSLVLCVVSSIHLVSSNIPCILASYWRKHCSATHDNISFTTISLLNNPSWNTGLSSLSSSPPVVLLKFFAKYLLIGIFSHPYSSTLVSSWVGALYIFPAGQIMVYLPFLTFLGLKVSAHFQTFGNTLTYLVPPFSSVAYSYAHIWGPLGWHTRLRPFS